MYTCWRGSWPRRWRRPAPDARRLPGSRPRSKSKVRRETAAANRRRCPPATPGETQQTRALVDDREGPRISLSLAAAQSAVTARPQIASSGRDPPSTPSSARRRSPVPTRWSQWARRRCAAAAREWLPSGGQFDHVARRRRRPATPSARIVIKTAAKANFIVVPLPLGPPLPRESSLDVPMPSHFGRSSIETLHPSGWRGTSVKRRRVRVRRWHDGAS
jgi:hypothetical protein